MRTKLISTIEALLEAYLKDSLELGLSSSAGRVDGQSLAALAGGDYKLVKYLEAANKWAWLVRFVGLDNIYLLLNESLAKVTRKRTKRVATTKGSLEVQTECELLPMTQAELARAQGLTVRQYQRKLTKAREAIHHALQDRLRPSDA